VGFQLLALREGEPDGGRLGGVVERRQPVVRGGVLLRAVGHLDDEPARPADEQREREVACDEVRVERQAQHPQTAFEIVLPDQLVALSERCSPVLRPVAVDRRARLARGDRGAAPGAAGRARHERHLAAQRPGHLTRTAKPASFVPSAMTFDLRRRALPRGGACTQPHARIVCRAKSPVANVAMTR
jgi:hypothetical protein